jgi:hypothetical protein
MPDDKTWYVTFGPDHRLTKGAVTAESVPGRHFLPLGRCYAAFPSETREAAMARVIEVFGPGNWAELYDEDRGRQVVRQHHLGLLFGPYLAATMGAIPLCDCLGLPYAHCAGAHDEDEDEVPRFSDGSRAPDDWSYPDRRPLDDLDENPEETQ